MTQTTSARVVFDFTHAFSERLKLVNNFSCAYEVEPNFGLGAFNCNAQRPILLWLQQLRR